MAKSPQMPDRDDPPIADASALFGDDAPARPAQSGRSAPAPTDDVFEIEGGDLPASEVAPPPLPTASRPRRGSAEERKTKRSADEAARVEQVWSRGAEWGPSIVLLAVVGLIGAVLVYATFSADNLGLSFLILMAVAAVWVVLTYPIVVTLEKPLRMVPEQAAKDYYAALSHHLPHYRRMWLLLSSAGRTSSYFGSLDGFKSYWKKRLAELRGSSVKATTPLDFHVEEFRSEKSAGQTFVEGRFKVNVFVRGRYSEGPIESVNVEAGFVKGPDGMWYLNKGTLPGGRV